MARRFFPGILPRPLTTPIQRYLKRYRLILVMVISRNSESHRNQLIRKLLHGAPDEVLVELVNIKETIMIRRSVSQVEEPAATKEKP